jgi:hypothetical protein
LFPFLTKRGRHQNGATPLTGCEASRLRLALNRAKFLIWYVFAPLISVIAMLTLRHSGRHFFFQIALGAPVGAAQPPPEAQSGGRSGTSQGVAVPASGMSACTLQQIAW